MKSKLYRKAGLLLTGLILIALLGGCLYFIRAFFPSELDYSGVDVTIALGFTLIVSFLAGKISEEFNLPAISGYIVAGIVFGPYLFNLITSANVTKLQLLDNLALGLIALTAGGELKLEQLKDSIKSIVSISVFQSFIVFGVMSLLSYWYMYLFNPFGQSDRMVLIAISLIIGVTATANSPATIIAIITETKSSGVMTDTALGVTVIKDVLVMTLFAIVMSISKALINPDVPFDTGFIYSLSLEVGISLLLGIIAGFLITLYLIHVSQQLVLFILGVAFILMEIAQIEIHTFVDFHLSGLLMCMAAGFFVANFSDEGEKFIHYIEKGSLPIYILFFTIAGAGLDMKALAQMWIVAVFLVIGRTVTTFLGTWFGERIITNNPDIKYFSWMGFIAQAGVTVGLVVLISQRFPDWGPAVATAVMAALAVNQLLGPPLFKYALDKAGESTK